MQLHEIPYGEAARNYEEQAKAKLPLSDQEFREVISAEYMVLGRKGSGGPQVEAVMQIATTAHLDIDTNTTKYSTNS